MRTLDTNIILRYLLGESQAEKIEKLFLSKARLFLPDVVFSEVYWVLSSFYKLEKKQIVEMLKSLLEQNSVVADQRVLLHTLRIFEEENVKFVDAYIASVSLNKKIKEIYSYDKHFDKIKGIKRLEP